MVKEVRYTRQGVHQCWTCQNWVGVGDFVINGTGYILPICRVADKYMTEVYETHCSRYIRRNELPSTEQRGKWIERRVFGGEGTFGELQSAKCSVCNTYHTIPYLSFFKDENYCPNCGARMDAEE